MGGVLCCLGEQAACCAGRAVCGLCTSSCGCCGLKQSTSTRLTYSVMFLVATIVACILNSNWFAEKMADAGSSTLHLFPCTSSDGASSCYGALAVLRISLGMTLFHAAMCLFTYGIKTSEGARAGVHNGAWGIKVLVWLAAIIGCFWIPAKSISQYDIAAMFGGWIFILIQLLLLIDFAHLWNDRWVGKHEEAEHNGWAIALGSSAFLLFAGVVSLTGVMYAYFVPGRSECSLNTFFITFNLLAVAAATAVSVNPRVQEKNPRSGILQAGVVGLYSTWLVWSAIASEPATDDFACNRLTGGTSGSVQDTAEAFGLAFAFVSVVVAALSMSSSHDRLRGGGGGGGASDGNDRVLLNKAEAGGEAELEAEEAQGVVYSYSFFHFSFMCGSMYVGLLLVGWNYIKADDDGTHYHVDQTMAAVWVKMASSWVGLLLYIWTLIAPICLPDRDFS